MVGVYSSTSSRLVVIGGILTIAIADALSDALGIHISEEAENAHSEKEIVESNDEIVSDIPKESKTETDNTPQEEDQPQTQDEENTEQSPLQITGRFIENMANPYVAGLIAMFVILMGLTVKGKKK